MKSLIVMSLFLTLEVGAQTAEIRPNSKSIEQRLYQIEQQQREFEQWYSDFYIQSKGRVTPFLGEKISFGGFFETTVVHIEGPDTESQTSANAFTLGINLAADFDDKIRFVSQFLTGFSYPLQNLHNNPNLTPTSRQYGSFNFGSLVAQGYVEYTQSEAFIVQSGLGYVPFGYAFQQREPVLLKRRGGPMLTSASDAASVGLAAPLWMGLHLKGSFGFKKGRMGYNLYSFTPSTNPKTMGGGTRFWWSDSQYVTAGVSLQSARQLNNSYYSYGTDINFKWRDFGFVAEYAKSVISGDAPALSSYYFEPSYELYDGEWVVYGVADYISNPSRAVGAINDGYVKWQLGGGVNWLPIPNARFRLGILQNDYIAGTDSINGQSRDYYCVDFSTGIAF